MSSQPERYDLNEMMSRLKSRSTSESPEDGELVTRADGSQAIRVRRRKRRSRQPHKERQQRIRVIQIITLVVAVVGVLLSFGFLTVYVNTGAFRKQVVEKLRVTSGADVDLQQFRMNPTGANASGADLSWPSGNMLQSLSLRTLRADVSLLTVFGGHLGGEEMKANTGNLTLRFPESGQLRRATPAAQGELPVKFNQYTIRDLQIQLLGETHPVVRLFKSEATLIPRLEGSDKPSMLRLSRGDLKARDWPEFRLNRAHIEFMDDRAQVVGMRLKHPEDENGTLELSGPLRPYDSDGSSELAVVADGFLLGGVVGDSLGRLLVGRVDATPELGPNRLHLDFGSEPRAELKMTFQGMLENPFELQNLPFLFALSQTLGDEWFSRPDFRDEARGMLLREGNRVEVSELELSSKGRMAVRGHLRSEKGDLSGQLEVGVSHVMIMGSENRVLDAMFGEEREGYRWITLELSGTAIQPKDEFSKRYQQALEALQNQPEEGAKPDGVSGGASDFEELTRPR